MITAIAAAAESLTCLILSNFAVFKVSNTTLSYGISASQANTVSVYSTSKDIFLILHAELAACVTSIGKTALTNGVNACSIPMINASSASKTFEATFG